MLATDRSAVDRATATFAPEQIGRTQYLTPEGFLCCEGVRIARTGAMLYTQAEMPGIEPGPLTSMITMLRDAEALFDPDCILSFAGKPVTNDHPNEPVTPSTFKDVAVGTVLNPRRGEGAESEYLISDLLITDKDAIAAIQARKRELSPGYDVDVEQVQPGVGRQIKIVGNHVALVARGRGGPACSIQDEEPTMAKRTNRILDGIRKAFKAKDEAALEEQLGKAEEMMDDDEGGGEGEGSSHHLVIEVKTPAGEKPPETATDDEETDPSDERLTKIEGALSSLAEAVAKLQKGEASEAGEETPTGDEDPEAKEEEREAEKATAQDAMSKAEILAPGIKLPAMDSLKNSAVTELRRSALKTAVADSARKVHVEAVLAGRKADFDAMKPSQVSMVFDAAAAVARAANNSGRLRPLDIPQGPMTAARYQEMIRERRKERA